LGQQAGDELVVGDGSAQLEELVDLAGQTEARLEPTDLESVACDRSNRILTYKHLAYDAAF